MPLSQVPGLPEHAVAVAERLHSARSAGEAPAVECLGRGLGDLCDRAKHMLFFLRELEYTCYQNLNSVAFRTGMWRASGVCRLSACENAGLISPRAECRIAKRRGLWDARSGCLGRLGFRASGCWRVQLNDKPNNIPARPEPKNKICPKLLWNVPLEAHQANTLQVGIVIPNLLPNWLLT